MLWLRLRRLRSKDYDTRVAAFATATRERDYDALIEVIDDPDQYTRQYAIRALGEIADRRAVSALIKRLDDDNFNNVEDAARALARIGNARAFEPLLAVLRSPKQHKQARGTVAKEITRIAGAKAIPLLLEALTDADAFTRYLVLEVLESLGDSRGVPGAVAALDDSDSDVRWAAVKALRELGDSRAVDPLLALLRQTENGPGPGREAIIDALGRIGDRRAGPALVPLLQDGKAEIRKAATTALDAMGWQPSDEIESAHRAVASQRWDQLRRLDWEVARAALVEALQLDDTNVRENAVVALASIGGQRALEPILRALTDPEESVSNAAAVALVRIGDVDAVLPLLNYSRRYRPEGHYENNPMAPEQERDRANESTQPLIHLLERTIARVPRDVLDMLAREEDRRFELCVEYATPAYGEGRDNFLVLQSFARVRSLAREECRRRDLA